MISEVPLTFVKINFLETYYYNRNDDNDPFYSTAKDFQGCITHFHKPNDNEPKQGELLQIEEWTSLRKPKEPSNQVLLQVFNLMPTWLNKLGSQNGEQYLHSILVKPWTICDENSFMGFWGKGRKHLGRMISNHTELFLALDRPVTLSVNHLFKTGHIGLLMDQAFYDELVTRSKNFRRVPNFRWTSSSSRVGLTKEEDLENRQNYIRASNIKHSFGFIDSSFVTLEHYSKDSDLSKLHAVIIDNLADLFSAPFDLSCSFD